MACLQRSHVPAASALPASAPLAGGAPGEQSSLAAARLLASHLASLRRWRRRIARDAAVCVAAAAAAASAAAIGAMAIGFPFPACHTMLAPY